MTGVSNIEEEQPFFCFLSDFAMAPTRILIEVLCVCI